MGPERIEQALDVFGPIFIQVYGQSEAPAQITVLTKRDHVRARENPDLLRSCGRPVAIVDVRCADDALASVPDGEPGEIVVRGPTVTPGYINKPEGGKRGRSAGTAGSAPATSASGDEQGYFYIVDQQEGHDRLRVASTSTPRRSSRRSSPTPPCATSGRRRRARREVGGGDQGRRGRGPGRCDQRR